MGCFDIFDLEVKCPYCGKVELRDCQAKKFGCHFEHWKLGDHIGEDFTGYVLCITDCYCTEERTKEGYKISNFFYVFVRINNGYVAYFLPAKVDDDDDRYYES